MEAVKENIEELDKEETRNTVIGDAYSDKVNKLLSIDLELDDNLLNVVLKSRILDFLLSGSKEERIEKQIVFFSNICSNILENYQEKLKENISFTYILNKYKPGKYSSLAYLFKRDKPIGKDNLSFFIDEILKDKDLLNNSVINIDVNNISKEELLASQIGLLSPINQELFLEKICDNYKKINKIKDSCMKIIVGLVGGWEKLDRKTKKKGYEKYLFYRYKGKGVRLYKNTIYRLSETLLQDNNLGKGIINYQNFELILFKDRISDNCFDIDLSMEKKLKEYNFKRELLTGEREEVIEKQKKIFLDFAQNIETQEKDSFTILRKFLWKKETKESFALRRLMKGTHPIGENNLDNIFDIIFREGKVIKKIVNIEEIEISNKDLLFFHISGP